MWLKYKLQVLTQSLITIAPDMFKYLNIFFSSPAGPLAGR